MKTNKLLLLICYYCINLALLIAEISAFSLCQFHCLHLTFCWLCICIFFQTNISVILLAGCTAILSCCITCPFFSTDLLLLSATSVITTYFLPRFLKIKTTALPLAVTVYLCAQSCIASLYSTPLYTLSTFTYTLLCNVLFICITTFLIMYITKKEVE